MNPPSVSRRAAALSWIALAAGTVALPSLVSLAAGGQDWFDTLAVPALTPPDWVFGTVWPLLYLGMGTAAWIVWRRRHRPGAGRALGLYGGQLALNIAWIVGFFGLESVLLGLVLIVPLGIAVAATLVAFARVSRAAGALFVPYLAWIGFASLLAWQVWRLNA